MQRSKERKIEQQPDYGYGATEGLILSRLDGETIVIGDGLVVIKVLKTARGRCSIRVQAPRGMRILRSEVADRDRQAAAS